MRPDPCPGGSAATLTRQRRGPLRLGVVSYLNAVPLVHDLGPRERFELVREVPARVAALLHADEIELGMIPSIEYARGEYTIVPRIGIGSRGPVRSVLLLHRAPLARVRRVALDASSRTSVALLKILLSELVGGTVEYTTLPPDPERMLEHADAALLIGDPALDYHGDLERLDLGEEWSLRTGLPFVYAFWAGRAGAVTDSDAARLEAALRRGLAALPEIASSYAAAAGPDARAGDRAESYLRYLRSHIVYDFGKSEQQGLREFYRRAHALGLIPSVPELRFYGDS